MCVVLVQYIMIMKLFFLQLSDYREKLNGLRDSSAKRESYLIELEEELTAFNADMRQACSNIDMLRREVSDQQPISGDVEGIRDQQDYFKQFTKSEVDPTQKELEGLTHRGQTLIQSAGPGVNTEQLEADLDLVNDRWGQLSQKVTMRFVQYKPALY